MNISVKIIESRYNLVRLCRNMKLSTNAYFMCFEPLSSSLAYWVGFSVSLTYRFPILLDAAGKIRVVVLSSKDKNEGNIWRMSTTGFTTNSCWSHVELRPFSFNKHTQCSVYESKPRSNDCVSFALTTGHLRLHPMYIISHCISNE